MADNVPIDINALIKENELLKERLKKYIDGKHQKEYYQNNKDVAIKRANERLVKLKETNPDKIKEYNKRAYQKRKEKLAKLKNLEEQSTNI